MSCNVLCHHHYGWWQSTLQDICGRDPSSQLPQSQWRSNGDLNFPASAHSAKLLPGPKSCHPLASQSKGLQNDINVLLFSDHGMTDIAWADKVIELKNYINMSDTIQMKDRGPVVSLWPTPEKHAEVSTAYLYLLGLCFLSFYANCVFCFLITSKYCSQRCVQKSALIRSQTRML